MFPPAIAFGSSAFSSSPVFPAAAYGCDLLLFDGDSNTSNNQAGITPYPEVLKAAYGHMGHFVNQAKSGDNLAAILARVPQAAALAANGMARKFYFCMGGTNDIGDGTEASMIDNITDIWADARTAGFIVVAMTMMPQTGYSPQNQTDWDAYNNFIIGASSLWDFLCRPDQALSNPADTDYFYDGTHLTQLGCNTLATHVATVLGL